MANTTNQQQAAPTMEQTLNQSEAFFLKYKKAIITVVVAIIVIIVGAVLYKTYIAEPNEQKASTAIAKGQDTVQNSTRLEGSQCFSTLTNSSHKQPELILSTIHVINGDRTTQEGGRRTINAHLHKLSW